MFVRYASCFIAMQMGRRLLKELGVDLDGMDHRNSAKVSKLVEEKGEVYFAASLQDVDNALKGLYGGQEISLQQLSATFRRGDLIENLLKTPV